MTELQKKWITDGLESILKLKNAIDTIRALKKEAIEKKDYETAAIMQQKESEFKTKLSEIVEINFK